MNLVVMDIGGTNTRVAKMINGKIEEIIKFSTFQQFPKEVEKIVESIKKLNFEFSNIGISAPGPSDYKKGIFGSLPNLPLWEGKNLISELNKEFPNVKIKMANDANLMALAHHHYFKNEEGITQFFTISTGLGAGLIIDNKIYSGINSLAQEIACAPLAFSKEKGKGLPEGALELFASGSGISYRAKMDTKEAMALYGKKRKITKIIDEGIDALANAIATSVAFVAPNLIVFDGSVARHHEFFIELAWEKAKTRMAKEHAKLIRKEMGKLNDDSALIGASYIF